MVDYEPFQPTPSLATASASTALEPAPGGGFSQQEQIFNPYFPEGGVVTLTLHDDYWPAGWGVELEQQVVDFAAGEESRLVSVRMTFPDTVAASQQGIVGVSLWGVGSGPREEEEFLGSFTIVVETPQSPTLSITLKW